jgi:hypothetical protein
MSTRALFLPVSEGDFKPALTLGSTFPHPKERAGSPVSYWWKEMLRPGVRVFDKQLGRVEEIKPERVRNIHANYKRAKAAIGFEPALPIGSHDVKNAKNAGWLVDAEVKADGSLWGLHQFIGDDAAGSALAASYKSSISTITNYTDEHGNFYDELPDHNALLVNPMLSCVQDFVPAIAASRGHAIETVSLELAAPSKQEVQMDLSKLRTKLGAAADVPDDKVIELAEQRIGELATVTEQKVQLSRDLDNANGRIASLGTPAKPAKPSAEQLHYLGRTLALARDDAAKAIGSHAVTEAQKRFLNAETYDVGALTLSREPVDEDGKVADGMRRFIDFCELAKFAKPGPTGGEKTGPQGQAIALARPDPDGDKAKDKANEPANAVTQATQEFIAGKYPGATAVAAK